MPFVLALLLERTARAEAPLYQPIKPSTCLSYSDYPYSYSSQADLEDDTHCGVLYPPLPNQPCPHYANNITHYRTIAANAWTDRVQMRLAWLNMAGPNDYLYCSDGILSNQTPAGTWVNVLGTLPLTVITDDDGLTAPGFEFDRIRACTTRAQPAVDSSNPLVDGVPTIGVLLGYGDGMTFSFQLGQDEHAGVALHQQGTADFDMYAECGSRPTWNSSYSSIGTSSDEFIHVKGCQTGDWSSYVYVSIRSYAGAGPFTLTLTKHMANKDLHLRAATNFPALATTATTAAHVLGQAAKRIYGASEGRIFIESWNLYAGTNCLSCGGSPCDFCFKDICTACGTGGTNHPGAPWAEVLGCVTGACTGPYSQFMNASFVNGLVDDPSNDFGASRRSAHELGHKIGDLPDEYDGTSNECGHTMMAVELWRPAEKNFCNHHNHGKDPDPSTPPPGANGNQAVLLNGGFGPDVLLSPQLTPDSYDYADFDFADKLGTVTVTGATYPPATVPWGDAYLLGGLAAILIGIGARKTRGVARDERIQ